MKPAVLRPQALRDQQGETYRQMLATLCPDGLGNRELGGLQREAQLGHAGQPLVEVDFDAVRAAGFDPTVFVIVCERSENSTLREHASGPVAVKEPVVWLSE